MSLTPPSVDEARDQLARLGFEVTDEEFETFHALVTETLETYDRTAELDEPNDRSARDAADRS